ncbi:hypothetical protein MYX64_01640 [Nitrospinae bacterium AH_259_B05_G02_I21]|nr:hypothetical protein [Nitrospinae bacterium AH_259_B05_G02_I21]MDA2932140.1 hypothetical protein [Nitrospinae bacterium AH-259-F20]
MTVLDQARNAFRRYMYMEDDTILDVVMAVAASNRLPGDPVWMHIVGPSGGGKTEVLRALRGHPDVYTISSFTENTLVSGLKGGKDPSLLPDLNGKVVVIKDFTALLSLPNNAFRKISGDLRDAHDGYYEKAFGTGDVRRYESRFTLLTGVTPAIEKMRTATQTLGERFLMYRVPGTDRLKAAEASRKAVETKELMRKELQGAVHAVLDAAKTAMYPDVSPKLGSVLDKLANLLAIGRSHVDRDGYRQERVLYMPEPEEPGRVVGQLTKFLMSLAAVREVSDIREEELYLVRRVVKDSLPSMRRRLLVTLLRNRAQFVSTKDLGNSLQWATDTARIHLADLMMLGMVERREQGQQFEWLMAEDFVNLIMDCGFHVP